MQTDLGLCNIFFLLCPYRSSLQFIVLHCTMPCRLVNIQNQPTTKKQVGKLLDMMSRRSAKAFDAFIEALVLTDQEHVAEVLDPRQTATHVQIRDAKRSQNSHTIAQPSGSSEHSGVASSEHAVVPTSSLTACQTLSSQQNVINVIQSSPAQCTPTPSGMCLSFLCNPCFSRWQLT